MTRGNEAKVRRRAAARGAIAAGAALLVGGCGAGARHEVRPPLHGASPDTRSGGTGAAAGAFQPAAIYAALFVPGARWRYDLEARSPDDHAPAGFTIRDLVVTCTVAEVRPLRDAVGATLTCDGPHDEIGAIAGAWVADARGLWRVDELPAAGAAIAPPADALVLPAAPHADTRETDAGTRTIERRDGAWCETFEGGGDGPATSDTLCFDGRGVVSGEDRFAPGAPTDEETRAFTRRDR